MKTLERTEDHGEEGWGRMTVCGLVESGGPAPRRPRPPPKASSPAPCRDSASSKLHSLFAAEEVGGGQRRDPPLRSATTLSTAANSNK